jgi:hypothetical protein
MRHARFVISCVALLAATVLSGCGTNQPVAQNGTSTASSHHVAHVTLPSGTSIDIALATPLTSETAGVGSGWTGTTRNTSLLNGRSVIPAGSAVAGTVTGVKPAHKGDRAMLDLGLTSITIDGRSYRVNGSTESIIAGSTRARNLGAIGAATVAGAVIGHQINNSDKGTVIGGLVGAGAATAVVAESEGYQVVLKAGTPLTFTTNEALAVSL